ncbi:hypothetical protein LWI29_037329 [Acer saccharum]|uniref:Retrotransposon gag domain-containing protein n=1 Tax=Acer saccharum TaxID=4024 RepID=A0AA39T9E5_ACESA|nr:hypothetical protein LWI29_037329 [Acer saccharum]
MAQRYRHNVSSNDELDNPFIDQIAHTRFPERFKKSTIEQYKENRDPKEHVRRFRNVVAQYVSNDGLLCLTFLQTFGDLASRKEVAQIEDASDVSVIAAFTNGLQSGRLSFDLWRDRPKTYEEMMDMAGDYALAEDKEVSQGGSYVHGHKPDTKLESRDDKTKTQSHDRQRDEKSRKGQSRESRGSNRASRYRSKYNSYTHLTDEQEDIISVVKDKGLAKYPRQQSANARRDTTKYCHLHKGHGHNTSKCFQLHDHIESLIRDGHFKDFTLKGDKHGGRQDSHQGSGQERKSPRKSSLSAAINTIFGGPHTSQSNRERMSEV